jgi:MoaA/NifB/PqqE/SkfB family radical SAM enzyme
MQKTYTDRIFELAKISKQVIAVPFALSFRYCNNNCKFCYLQPNMRKIPLSLDECKQLVSNYLNWLRDNICRFEPDMSFLVELIGGELFIMNDD